MLGSEPQPTRAGGVPLCRSSQGLQLASLYEQTAQGKPMFQGAVETFVGDLLSEQRTLQQAWPPTSQGAAGTPPLGQLHAPPSPDALQAYSSGTLGGPWRQEVTASHA